MSRGRAYVWSTYRVRYLQISRQVEREPNNGDPFIEPEQHGCPRQLPRPEHLNLIPGGDDKIVQNKC